MDYCMEEGKCLKFTTSSRYGSLSAALSAYELSTSRVSVSVKCNSTQGRRSTQKTQSLALGTDAWMRLKLPVVCSGVALFHLLPAFLIHQCPDL